MMAKGLVTIACIGQYRRLNVTSAREAATTSTTPQTTTAAFRLGAIALAAGAGFGWADSAEAARITQGFNLPMGIDNIDPNDPGTALITIGDGNPGTLEPQFLGFGFLGFQMAPNTGAGVAASVQDVDDAGDVYKLSKNTDIPNGGLIGPASSFLTKATIVNLNPDGTDKIGGMPIVKSSKSQIVAKLATDIVNSTKTAGGGHAYIGLTFTVDGINDSSNAPLPLYGYAVIDLPPLSAIEELNNNDNITAAVWPVLNSIVYDDTGAAVQLNYIPEPGSLGLLALGAAGLAGLRRRRAQAVH